MFITYRSSLMAMIGGPAGAWDCAILEPKLASQDFPPYKPVAEKTETGISEGGRLVMFKEEMSDPSECVALHKGDCN